MDLKQAKEIGKIRKLAMPPVGKDVEGLAIEKEKHLLKVRKIEDQLDRVNRKSPQKVEVTNQPRLQKIEGKTETEVKNWPDIFKVAGEVAAKVVFPAVQKITGAVTAKVSNFPVIQKVVGVVDVKNLPEVQKVSVVNPVERMHIEGETTVKNLPLGKSDKEGDPERFMAVRFTDGKRYYDLSELTLVGGGGGVRQQDEDRRWLREDFTYDASGNVTTVVSYDGQGFKKTVDYEYDANDNITRKTTRFEDA